MMRMLSEEESKAFLEKHKPKADLDEMITLITGLYRKECDQGIDPVLTKHQTEELLILLNDYKCKNHEIVRCKDCKHRPEVKERKIYGRVEKYPVFPEDSICPACNTSDSYYSWIPDDDWFCADGEREVANEP